jgi:hypothetical protein
MPPVDPGAVGITSRSRAGSPNRDSRQGDNALDLYSRKIVGFEVHNTDSVEHAAHLARRTALAEQVHAMPVRPVLPGDNGATLKATTVLAMLHWLGIKPSYSPDQGVRRSAHRQAMGDALRPVVQRRTSP